MMIIMVMMMVMMIYDDDEYNYKAEKKRKEPKASLCRAKSSMLGTIESSSRENTFDSSYQDIASCPHKS